MRLRIAAIGRMKSGPERELVARYLDRAVLTGKPLGLTGFDIAEALESRATSPAARKTEEARALRDASPPGGFVLALDEHGKSMGSEAFATLIARERDAGRSAMTCLIGSADGLDPTLIATADLTLSFSPLTWPHQLVRILVAEQLYRTTTILSNHPYHRGD